MNVIKETKQVPVTTYRNEDTYTLELSKFEAEALLGVSNRIGGVGPDRVVFDNFASKLHRLGLKTPRFDNTDPLYPDRPTNRAIYIFGRIE